MQKMLRTIDIPVRKIIKEKIREYLIEYQKRNNCGKVMSKVSLESMKLIVQLSYILSLSQLQMNLDNKKINNIGFVVFDSPKNKDLDKDKYERFLKCLSESNVGQILLTGSDKNEE